MEKSLIIVFWSLVTFSVATASLIFVPKFRKYRPFRVLIALVILLSLLGGVQVYLLLKQNVDGTLKIFLILAGASPVAMIISVILHNLISGFLTARSERDIEEAVFFLFSVFGCPTTFLVGVVGSIVLIIKDIFNTS